MDGNNQPFHRGQFILRRLRRHEGNALAAYMISHRVGLVETKQFVPVVDKQVEMSEETLTQNSPNPRIGCSNLSKVVDDNERLVDYLRVGFQPIQNSYRGLRNAGDGNKADPALRLEIEF